MVILFDVDNTLLDNDRVTADLGAFLTDAGGSAAAAGYFSVLEALRTELGYADYLGALQLYRASRPHDFPFFGASAFLVDYPFAARLYAGALAAVRHAGELGEVAILSDGDAVFQPLKIGRSGLGTEVGGRVHIYVHKEQELGEVERLSPADHYVMVDDKRRLLAAIKAHWLDRVTTVWVRQGHYATAPDVDTYAEPDVAIDAIGDFPKLSAAELRAAARPR